MDNDVLFIAFDVAGYGSRAHVRFIAQNGIADVIIVRGLHAVEKDAVFQLAGIADHRAVADEHVAADKRAGAHLGLFANHARACDAGRRRNRRRLGDPHIRRRMIVSAQIERSADFEHRFADVGKRFPRIFARGKHLFRAGMR